MHDDNTDLKKELVPLHKERELLLKKISEIDSIISAKLGLSNTEKRKSSKKSSKELLSLCLQ